MSQVLLKNRIISFQEPIEVVLVFNRKGEPQSKVEVVEEDEEVEDVQRENQDSETHSDEGNEDLTSNPILEISERNWEQVKTYFDPLKIELSSEKRHLFIPSWNL